MKAILACEKYGGIGFEGSMPWPKQDKDLARFKELTLNKTVIMGRGTWESKGMPKPLPDRLNIVVTSQDIPLEDCLGDTHEYKGTSVGWVNSLDKITDSDDKWIIGGAKLIGSAWDQIDELHLSHLFGEYECDTAIDLDKLNEDFYCARSQLCLTHTYEIYRRRT